MTRLEEEGDAARGSFRDRGHGRARRRRRARDDAAADLDAARAEAAQYLDHLRRLQAEFDNYRKRVLKEQTQAIELAAEPTCAGCSRFSTTSSWR